jgi:predicted glycoside hydrolase/deacetylase ChbG (UPF0249 family)
LKIFLHTDDLAATESMSKGMLDRWMHGYLDGFSIMANGEAAQTCQQVLTQAAERPARLIAHLNLTEGPSSASPSDVPLLVNADGHLKHGFASLALLWLKSSSKQRQQLQAQVEQEWRAQLHQIITMVAPRQINGVDGHVHVHMLPFLFPIAARLARERGIATIRVTREPFHLERGWRDLFVKPVLVNFLKHSVLRACSINAMKVVRQAGLSTSDYVIGVMYSGRMTAASALAGIAAAQRYGAESVEVLFHVGRASEYERKRWGSNRAFSEFPCSDQRDQEFAELAILHQRLLENGLRNMQASSSN